LYSKKNFWFIYVENGLKLFAVFRGRVRNVPLSYCYLEQVKNTPLLVETAAHERKWKQTLRNCETIV